MKIQLVRLKIHSILLVFSILSISCTGQTVNQPPSISNQSTQVGSPLSVTVVTATQAVVQQPIELPTLTLPPPPQDTLWWEFPTSINYEQSFNYPQLWQLAFDPNNWELRMSESNIKMLVHLFLDECTIVKTFGHGLPPEYSVRQSHKQLGLNDFEVIHISYQNKLDSINYCTTIEDESSCFGLGLGKQAELCQSDGEAVLSTLITVDRPTP